MTNPQNDPHGGNPYNQGSSYQEPYPHQPYPVSNQSQYPYSPQPAYGYPPAQPQTDFVSVLSFVLALLGFNFVAVILGFVGLSRTKDGQMSGRGFAIAGIIIGSLSFIAIILLLIFGFAAMSNMNSTGALF